MQLLLISSSTVYGRGYLEHSAAAIQTVLGPHVSRVLFIPYALHDCDGYAAKVRGRFAELGLAVDSIHDAADGRVAVESAEAIFIGGGNTFRLLDALWRLGLVAPLVRKVRGGAPYIGSSAGTNVACVTIKTTNDMPIVQPSTFEALGLVPFNINPHYVDPVPGSTHMGETREERIMQFHEENEPPVVGLREGAWLAVDDTSVTLEGTAGARLFRRGLAPAEYSAGARLPL